MDKTFPFEGQCVGGRYCVSSFIGKGTYGEVYLAVDIHHQELVALKVLDLKKIKECENEKVRAVRKRLAQTESDFMKLFKH